MSKSNFSHRLISGCLLAVYWTTLFVGTHYPHLQVEVRTANLDKYLHLAAFSVLAALLSWFVAGMRPPTIKLVIGLLAVLVVYSAIDEVTQSARLGRSTEFWDFACDLVGSLVGLTAYFTFQHLCRGLVRPQANRVQL